MCCVSLRLDPIRNKAASLAIWIMPRPIRHTPSTHSRRADVYLYLRAPALYCVSKHLLAPRYMHVWFHTDNLYDNSRICCRVNVNASLHIMFLQLLSTNHFSWDVAVAPPLRLLRPLLSSPPSSSCCSLALSLSCAGSSVRIIEMTPCVPFRIRILAYMHEGAAALAPPNKNAALHLADAVARQDRLGEGPQEGFLVLLLFMGGCVVTQVS